MSSARREKSPDFMADMVSLYPTARAAEGFSSMPAFMSERTSSTRPEATIFSARAFARGSRISSGRSAIMNFLGNSPIGQGRAENLSESSARERPLARARSRAGRMRRGFFVSRCAPAPGSWARRRLSRASGPPERSRASHSSLTESGISISSVTAENHLPQPPSVRATGCLRGRTLQAPRIRLR